MGVSYFLFYFNFFLKARTLLVVVIHAKEEHISDREMVFFFQNYVLGNVTVLDH